MEDATRNEMRRGLPGEASFQQGQGIFVGLDLLGFLLLLFFLFIHVDENDRYHGYEHGKISPPWFLKWFHFPV